MKHQPTATAPGPGAWLTLAITLAIQAMTAMSLVALPAMAPVVATALGVSPALAGVYVAIVYAAGMVSTLAAGAAVARYGAIRLSQAGLVLCALGLAMCAVPSLWGTVIGALLIGLGYGPITPASSHLLAITTPAHRMSLVFSVKQTGVPLGGALAGAIVPSLMLLVGWQGALLCTAAMALLCAVIAQPLRHALDADRQLDKPMALGNLATPVRLVLAHPALLTLAGCSFVFSIAQLSLTSYAVIYMHETLAYGLVFAGLALSLSQLGGVAGRVLWGWIADHWFGARRILAVLAFIMVACCGGTKDKQQRQRQHAARVGAGAAVCLWCHSHRLERRVPGRGGAPGAARDGEHRHRRHAGLYLLWRGAGAAGVRGCVGLVWQLPRGVHGAGDTGDDLWRRVAAHARHGAATSSLKSSTAAVTCSFAVALNPQNRANPCGIPLAQVSLTCAPASARKRA
jgi:MFS family permease